MDMDMQKPQDAPQACSVQDPNEEARLLVAEKAQWLSAEEQEPIPAQQAQDGQEQTPAPQAQDGQEQTPVQPPKRGPGRPRKTAVASDWEILEDLSMAFSEAQVQRPDDYGRDKADGKWHRCLVEGQTGSVASGNGEYILHWDDPGCPVLVVYNFSGHVWSKRRYRQGKKMSRAERLEQDRKFKEHVAERLRQEMIEADAAAVRAQKVWSRLSPLQDVSGYLDAKGLADTYGLRGTADCIRVPLRNEAGEIRALQIIVKAGGGGFKKLFTKGCKMPGLFFEFPEDDGASGPIAVGEGLATVGTVVDVMDGWHGVAAMHCGNLDAVVGAVRRLYPNRKLVILADNDAFWINDAQGSRPHRKGERRPDGDNSGVVAARAAAQKHGVKVAVCPIADGKCTDFNDLFVRAGGGEAGAEAVRKALEAAQYVPGCPTPAGFELRMTGERPGLYSMKEGGMVGFEPVRLGPPILVEGHVRGADGQGWGILVAWQDPDGAEHRISLSRADMASRERIWLTRLVDGGYQADSGHAGELLRFLECCEPARRILAPARTGWLDEGQTCFVLPDRVIGAPAGTDPADVAYAGRVTAAAFRHAGTLEDWRRDVASLAAGNPKMTYCLCAAFAGPLLHVIGLNNSGTHLVGPSSTGKTTHLHLANSVWDSYESMGTWRATDNGKEAEAESRNDTLICLDEINEANAKTVGSVVYMLGNGQGKSRSKKDGSLREQKKFRLMFFSSGEVSLESIITAGGGTHMAGMDVRAMPVPLDKNDVKDCHGHGSARDLCDAVQAGARRFYGTAGPAFVERILPVLADAEHELRPMLRRENLRQISAEIIARAGHDADAADPQIQRIAETVSLICVAGLLAQELEIIPKEIEVLNSCITVLHDCIDFRGGTSSQEEMKIIETTASFIFANKDSAFFYIDKSGNVSNTGRPLAGFKRHIDGIMHYYILPDAMHKIWNGIAINTALRVLEEKKYIIPSPSQRGRRYFQQLTTIPFEGNRRWMYCIVLPDPEDAPEATAA